MKRADDNRVAWGPGARKQLHFCNQKPSFTVLMQGNSMEKARILTIWASHRADPAPNVIGRSHDRRYDRTGLTNEFQSTFSIGRCESDLRNHPGKRCRLVVLRFETNGICLESLSYIVGSRAEAYNRDSDQVYPGNVSPCHAARRGKLREEQDDRGFIKRQLDCRLDAILHDAHGLRSIRPVMFGA